MYTQNNQRSGGCGCGGQSKGHSQHRPGDSSDPDHRRSQSYQSNDYGSSHQSSRQDYNQQSGSKNNYNRDCNKYSWCKSCSKPDCKGCKKQEEKKCDDGHQQYPRNKSQNDWNDDGWTNNDWRQDDWSDEGKHRCDSNCVNFGCRNHPKSTCDSFRPCMNWKWGSTFYEWKAKCGGKSRALLQSELCKDHAARVIAREQEAGIASYNQFHSVPVHDIAKTFAPDASLIITDTNFSGTPTAVTAYLGANEAGAAIADRLTALGQANPTSRHLPVEIAIASIIGHTVWTNEKYTVVNEFNVPIAQNIATFQYVFVECDRALRVQGQAVVRPLIAPPPIV